MTSLDPRVNRSAPITGSCNNEIDRIVLPSSSTIKNRSISCTKQRLPLIENNINGHTPLNDLKFGILLSNPMNDVIISDITSRVIEIEERSRIKHMAEWSQYYRQWQTCLMLSTIAKHCHLGIADLFNTSLIPFLSSATYSSMSCPSNRSTTCLTQSLPPLSKPGMLTSKQAPIISHEKLITSTNLYSLKLNLNCSNFYHFKNIPSSKFNKKFRYSSKSCCVPVTIRAINYIGKRPKTVKLSFQFEQQLRKIQHWVKLEWINPILLIEFISSVVMDSPYYLLQHFARCLQDRLNNAYIDINCLTDNSIASIFNYLDYKSICRCSLVSRRWHQLANATELWKLKVFMF